LAGAPRRIILDTDPGVDDALALLFALSHPDICVEAVTCVAGNVSLPKVVRNGLGLLQLAGRTDIPLAAGADQPLARPLRDAAYAHGENGMNGLHLPAPSIQPVAQHAADLIIELSHRYPGQITICAVGPLTNLALALRKDPGLATRLDQILVMGGACFTHGNITAAAEFNIWCDPDAAQIVYESGARITQVGLDVTHHACLSRADVAELARRRPGPISDFVAALLAVSFERASAYHADRLPMHDPLTVALCVAPDLVETELMRVDIEVQGPLTTGMTVADRRPWRTLRSPVLPTNVYVGHRVDGVRFAQLFVDTVAAGPAAAVRGG